MGEAKIKKKKNVSRKKCVHGEIKTPLEDSET